VVLAIFDADMGHFVDLSHTLHFSKLNIVSVLVRVALVLVD